MDIMLGSKFSKKTAIIAIAVSASFCSFFGTINTAVNGDKNQQEIAFNFKGEAAQAGWQDFAIDYVKGKVVDECIFNGGCQKIADGYMNYYSNVRKHETELSHIQQRSMSPLRQEWEKSGKPCVTDNEWMRMVASGQV